MADPPQTQQHELAPEEPRSDGQPGDRELVERAQKGEAKSSSLTSKRDMSSGRRGGLRSGTNRPRGRTKEQLYNEAKRMSIPGRSKMNKAQLQRAVDRRK